MLIDLAKAKRRWTEKKGAKRDVRTMVCCENSVELALFSWVHALLKEDTAVFCSIREVLFSREAGFKKVPELGPSEQAVL